MASSMAARDRRTPFTNANSAPRYVSDSFALVSSSISSRPGSLRSLDGVAVADLRRPKRVILIAGE